MTPKALRCQTRDGNSPSGDAARLIERGKEALHIEAAGLIKLAGQLDGAFARAVEIIGGMKARKAGRLIVAGIGKSGHIARKVAATLSSTGTPSFFVHPGEASHGDLGMITGQDVVLLLSNSGENSELSDIIAYTRRFGIPLIAMTSNAASTLARHADVALITPRAPEACPNGLAPTTSTTMMVALGDALSVVLLEEMGLTPEQYKVFHPGGKLGQKLRTVAETMVRGDDLPVVDTGCTMDKAILAMTSRNVGSLLIVDAGGRLAGIITDGDLKRHMGPDLLSRRVTSVMSVNPLTISAGALAAEALDIMLNTKDKPVTSLVVLDDDGRPEGLIRVQECLQAGVA